jgi:hypothetical protein
MHLHKEKEMADFRGVLGGKAGREPAGQIEGDVNQTYGARALVGAISL